MNARARIRGGLVGTALLSGGLLAMGATRALLFEGAPAPHRSVAFWGNHLTVPHNVFDLIRALRLGDARDLGTYAVLACLTIWVALRFRRPDRRLRNAALLVGSMAAGIFVFGLVLETRSWIFTLPWLLVIATAPDARPVTAAVASSASLTDSR
jgi:hypothetical protein